MGKNGFYYKNKQPKWIIDTKYTNKALENNNSKLVFFKKIKFLFQIIIL